MKTPGPFNVETEFSVLDEEPNQFLCGALAGRQTDANETVGIAWRCASDWGVLDGVIVVGEE
jgi:hypothetical protein